ncbi:aromatic ring-hydroxylating oxygenase subunit alpha [Methylovorus mays]|uniref:aromatic ring-hydroxylating oxygenase subunit alpha n=1 Tax=Methylovorus mays TaxID=184077 RepID=UPI001E411BE3|nr:aromatic ring-hydroxylating dioxygenase subunit alpha [Methylovorus mays]MCB5208275.1 aromatic ring-hydroxylating dioxygenase subunit alpha [Methylovorus mays]
MTTGLILPDFYRNPAHLAHEYNALFKAAWNFVGMRFELEGGLHRGIKVADTDLLIQLDKSGKPRAYRNVCSHRHAQLCDQGLHHGPVRCPYHSWTYDREGIPVGIPQQQAFPEVVANPAAYRLQEFACEVAGQFIFVRLSENGPSLQDYLGEEFDFLCRASTGMTSVHDEFRQEVEANWKVVIENSLEGYHVPAVHNKTFMQVEGMQRGYEAPVDHLEHPLHSHIVHPADPEWLASFERRVEPKLGKWHWRFANYTHHLIFPNLTVTSFMGYSYHVQRFEPTAVDRTTVHSRSVGVGFEGQSAVGAKMLEQIYSDSKHFTERVFGEDGDICKAVQLGLNSAVNPAVIGNGIESRVAHFHRAYQAMLHAEAA